MLRVTVVAHPGARVERVEVLDDDTLGVWVRARPVEGQANAAIRQLVARVLGLRPREVNLIAGSTARRKILEVDLPDVQALRDRVMAYGLRADAR
jgi:uncharacterized protein